MFKPFSITIIVFVWLSFFVTAGAFERTPEASEVEFRLFLLEENGTAYSVAQVAEAVRSGRALAVDGPYASDRLSVGPVWLIAEVMNPGSQPRRQRVALGSAWLDVIDIYVRRQEQILLHQRFGDAYPYDQRPVDNRFFAIDVVFEPGQSQVFWRVDTADPKVMPVHITDVSAAQQRELTSAYYYGVIYGVLLLLLLYNLLLGISLKNLTYQCYSAFITAFLLMNMSYTGHGYAWLWPDSPVWEKWSNAVLMTVYVVLGLLFAYRFLRLRDSLPRVGLAVIAGCGVISVAQLAAIAMNSQAASIQLASVEAILFSMALPLLGALSWWHGNRLAKYFVAATFAGVSGTAITVVTAIGVVPYYPEAFYAMEIGMILEAVLLSLALAAQLRSLERKTLLAEQQARIDPLTELSNRRGFYQQVGPLWQAAVRAEREVSVVLLDIDHFKQVNDRYGHETGDRVLQGIAGLLSKLSRAADLSVRWGGEEFLLLLPDTGLIGAINVAERYRCEMEKLRFSLGGNEELKVTASFGVATREENQAKLEVLISSADKALYHAKEQGRNQVQPRAKG